EALDRSEPSGGPAGEVRIHADAARIADRDIRVSGPAFDEISPAAEGGVFDDDGIAGFDDDHGNIRVVTAPLAAVRSAVRDDQRRGRLARAVRVAAPQAGDQQRQHHHESRYT